MGTAVKTGHGLALLVEDVVDGFVQRVLRVQPARAPVARPVLPVRWLGKGFVQLSAGPSFEIVHDRFWLWCFGVIDTGANAFGSFTGANAFGSFVGANAFGSYAFFRFVRCLGVWFWVVR